MGVVACQKGNKETFSPNQDNFSITYFKNGWTLVCVFDGHGEDGHQVSTRTVKTVPYFLSKSKAFPGDIKAALIEAYESAHTEFVALGLQQGWDVMTSGTTAVSILFKDGTVWTANAGDSRCVIAHTSNGRLVYETIDQKPNCDDERRRIEATGAEVRTKVYPDGYETCRMYIKEEEYPGLAMSRTLGDECAKAFGVVATPEVGKCELDMSTSQFCIISSDGVWEFMSTEIVADRVASLLKEGTPAEALQSLHDDARAHWEAEEGAYCDDITSVLVQLS